MNIMVMEELVQRLTPKASSNSEYIPFNQLHRKPAYDEVIDCIETEPANMKYPDRRAIFRRT